MKTKLLIIVATHGNERIGLEVVKRLKRIGLGGFFDVLVGNPRALAQNTRFIDKDLNRSYPGNSRSKFYEERLAARNLKTARRYDLIIDLHEASAGRDDFIIMPRSKLSNKFPIELIDLRRVLLWPKPKGPISEVLSNSVELEFGMKGKNKAAVVDKATRIVALFIKRLGNKQNIIVRKDIYRVFGYLPVAQKMPSTVVLKDFRKVRVDGFDFYPLLVDQYLDLGIKCYKMRKINKY